VHTDSPETSVPVMADDQSSTGLRRRLIGAGIIGLAGSLLPRLASSAGASATTTTAPPQRPSADDAALLGFAQNFELAAVDLYAVALASDGLSDDTRHIITTVRQAHLSYTQSITALLGRDAPGTPLPEAVDTYGDSFAGDEASIVEAAAALEDTAVATHTELIGQLQGTDGVQLLAAMTIAEARHTLVFNDLAGVTDPDDLIFTAAEALAPEEG
jgi:hypothetical protein